MTGHICNIFYGTGTASVQPMGVHLGVSVTEGLIPAGTTFSWSVTTSGGLFNSANNEVPTPNYDENAHWTITMSPDPGTKIKSYTATMLFASDYTVPGGSITWCESMLIYDGSDTTIGPGTEFTITANGPNGTGVTGDTGSLTWKVPQREGTTNNPSEAMRFRSKTGTQKCFPEVRYSHQGNNPARMSSNGTSCGDGQNNTSTYYPRALPASDECKFFILSSGQNSHPEQECASE